MLWAPLPCPGAPSWQVTTVGCESGWKPEVNCQVTALNMSQVMSSPLLAGSPAVGLAPCEEPRRALHPAPNPSLPPQCPYYTTEGWRAQALMAPMPCKGPPGRLQPAPQAGANASCLLQAPGEQVSGARQVGDHDEGVAGIRWPLKEPSILPLGR